MSTGTARYARSSRPAVGIRVALLDMPDGIDNPAQGIIIETTYTDRDGQYTFLAPLPSNPLVTFSRGQLIIGTGPVGNTTLELEGIQAATAALLDRNSSAFQTLRTNAKKVLQRVLDSGTVHSCRSPRAALARPQTNDENPGIMLGSLLVACAIQLHFNRVCPGGSYGDDIPRLVRSILMRFAVLSAGTPGYIVRWRQKSDVHSKLPVFDASGNPVLIDRCAAMRYGTDTGGPGDASCEPSMDEYSGILFGFTWISTLANDADANATQLLSKLLTEVDQYFTGTRYWLIRPCNPPDLTLRGSVSGFASYGYDAAISRALGREASDGGQPLQDYGDLLPVAAATATRNLANNTYDKDDEQQYSQGVTIAETTIDFDWGLIGTIVEAPVVITAALVAGGAVAGPFGNALPGLPFLPIAVTTIDVAGLVLAFATGQTMWALFSQFVQWGMYGQPFNGAIYDRICLASYGNPFTESAWQLSAARPRKIDPVHTINDDGTTRVLTTAASLWMGNCPNAFDDPASIIEEVAARLQLDASTNAVYWHSDDLAGYYILCLALDIDPELDWPVSDISYTFPLLLA